MDSEFTGPVNIGSEECITINELAARVIHISGKSLKINNIPGPTGACVGAIHNALIAKRLDWAPSQPLQKGLEETYRWIETQVAGRRIKVRALVNKMRKYASSSFDSSAKIYVSGHQGMLGGALVDALRARGAKNLLLRTRQELDLRDQGAMLLIFRLSKK